MFKKIWKAAALPAEPAQLGQPNKPREPAAQDPADPARAFCFFFQPLTGGTRLSATGDARADVAIVFLALKSRARHLRRSPRDFRRMNALSPSFLCSIKARDPLPHFPSTLYSIHAPGLKKLLAGAKLSAAVFATLPVNLDSPYPLVSSSRFRASRRTS